MNTTRDQRRGDRLRPKRSSRLYWHLTCLRQVFEECVNEHIRDRGARLLVDFGCGNIPYRPLIEPHVERYVACDLPGNELADVSIRQDGTLPFDAGEADLVFSSQVLEHVDSPAAYLAEAHRVLNDDGRLILSTHGVWRYHPDPQDYWRWTSAGLRKTLAGAGFEVLVFRGIMGPAATALQLWQDAVADSVPRLLRKQFMRYMQWRVECADRKCPAQRRDRDAGVYVTVARKANG